LRYLLAIAALVLAGVMLLLGIGQRTFLAGPAEIRYDVVASSDAGYAVIEGDAFANVPGQANVVVAGESAFIATGADRDVRAWVEPFDHLELVAEPAERAFTAVPVNGVLPAADDADDESADAADGEDEPQAKEPIDPRGSDLWTEERSLEGGEASGELRMPVRMDDDKAVIVATNGVDPLPADIAVVWVQDRNTPWAGPLLVAGAVLALVGGVLYLLAVDHDRRGLGPRRGRKGPLLGIRNMFSRRGEKSPQSQGAAGESKGARLDSRVAVPALGVALVLGLSGCSASYWPQFGEPVEQEVVEEAPAAVAPVPVTKAQIENIIERVSKVASESDDALSAEELQARFVGDALAQRTANYTIRNAVPDYAVIPPRITAEPLDYQLVQSTEGWPRTLFLTVASERGTSDDNEGAESEDDEAKTEPESSPSLAMTLTQESPHDNFMVSRVIALRGGISMPQAAPAEEGTALLAQDLESLLLPPGEVGAAFASVLQDGEESEQFELFDLGEDRILENYGKARTAQTKAQAEEQAAEDGETMSMVYSVTARQGDEPAVALSTGVGGALVATTVIEQQIMDSDGGRHKPQAAGAVSALSGLEGQQERIVQVLAHQLLFFVPSKVDEDAKIQLLGVTSELVGAGN